jgi:hypothetical protein
VSIYDDGAQLSALNVFRTFMQTRNIYPLLDDTYTIGDPSLRFKTINLALPNNTDPTYVVVNKGGGGGDAGSALGYIAPANRTLVISGCTITVKAGLITNATGTC